MVHHWANRSLSEGLEQGSASPENTQETCQICPADEWQPFRECCPQDRYDKSPGESKEERNEVKSSQTESDSPNDEPWRHFSFICSKELVDKVQSIARKEGFTIRSFMEYVMKQGVEAYESKYGKVKKIRTKTIREVM